MKNLLFILIISITFTFNSQGQKILGAKKVMEWEGWLSEREEKDVMRYDSANESYWTVDSIVSKLRIEYKADWVADYYYKIYSKDPNFIKITKNYWYFEPGKFYIKIAQKDSTTTVIMNKEKL